jgi:hypothetical protein
VVLYEFFSDDWVSGIGELHEIERRNFLFAAKRTSWMKAKQPYDIYPKETAPFLRPLWDASEKEILDAGPKGARNNGPLRNFSVGSYSRQIATALLLFRVEILWFWI